jgi:oligopeptidase B
MNRFLIYITATIILPFETGKDYPIYSRKKESLSAKEEIMLDCNELAKGKKIQVEWMMSISDDNQLATYAIDLVGRIYTLEVKI